MNTEIESELNQILMAAIQNDLGQQVRKKPELEVSAENEAKSEIRCSICCSQRPRYRCPACNMRTCSLECVRQHKVDENCTGKRDPTKQVAKKEMNDQTLLSDYRFLEDANRQVYGMQRNYEVNFKPYPKTNRNNILHQQSMARGFVLWTLPDGMSKKTENTTVITTVKGLFGKNNKPVKLFHFHIKWTLDLSTGKEAILNTKIVETWNIGKLVEKVIKSSNTIEFDQFDVKAEPGADERRSLHEEEEEDESSGHVSGGSVTVAETQSTVNHEHAELCKPIEPGKERFVYNVLMKRITGPEAYYLFAPEKSLRENLEGKALLEYPELILAPPAQWPYYHARLTDQVDYKKGKRPQRPDQVPRDEKEEKAGTMKKWSKAKNVNMKGVELEDWQKEALAGGGNKRRQKPKEKTRKLAEPRPNEPGQHRVQQPAQKLNGPEREAMSIGVAETAKSLTKTTQLTKTPSKVAKVNTMKFFDTSQISSDSE